jgi:tetratricopeptide (TPR) repeat protein
MVYHRRSEYDLALDALDKGLSHLDEQSPTIQAAHLYNMRTLIHRHQGRNEEALDWCQKSLETTSKINTPKGQQAMAHTYFNMGAIYWRRGELNEAINYCQQSVSLYQQLDNIVGLSDAYLNLSNVFADQGDWDQAGDALRQGLALKQQVGDVYGQGMMANNLGYLHLDRGEWPEAATLFEQCHTIWQQLGATRDEANTLSNLAQVRIYQKDWSQAYECLCNSQQLFTQIGSEEFLPELERRWGEYYLGTGELDEALSHARRSIDLAVAQEFSLEEGMSFRVLGEIYLARNESELAEAALRQSLQILENLNSEYEAAKTVLPLLSMVTDNSLTPDDEIRLNQAIITFTQLNAQTDLTVANSLARYFGLALQTEERS